MNRVTENLIRVKRQLAEKALHLSRVRKSKPAQAKLFRQAQRFLRQAEQLEKAAAK
jgi:hypothetical protein